MNERIVALDVGDRRIGIAVSDALGITAQPLETYTRVGYGPDVRHIGAICEKYDTKQILCGLPCNMDGSEGFQTQKVREFAQQLINAGLDVSYYDERMTTMLAEGALLEANMRREERKKKVDMVAAVMILESYLSAQQAKALKMQHDALQDGDPLADDSMDETDDEDSVEDVLEMEDEDGHVISFVLCARIPYQGAEYVLLSCVQDAGDFEKDESLIMRSDIDAAGEACYVSIDDQALIEAVYDAYLRQGEAQ